MVRINAKKMDNKDSLISCENRNGGRGWIQLLLEFILDSGLDYTKPTYRTIYVVYIMYLFILDSGLDGTIIIVLIGFIIHVWTVLL